MSSFRGPLFIIGNCNCLCSNLYLLSSDLERTENSLITEQQLIRDDVLRVANELEALEIEIERHVAINTRCLDGPVLSKKKRKKRSPV